MSDATQPVVYQIRLQGHLGPEWTTWFEELTITQEENGDTLLTGPVVDQAALYGLLRKVRVWVCHCSRSCALNPTGQMR